ncbi:MAG: type II toxin-antitoxin system RelE/ParE family toxin [Litorilituus sp.]|nr:type II toxin-antitoxin system RelE/ParE family toxin [Litorilituus sp.]
MKIEFSESAISDLQDIKSYYLEQQVPHIGEKFISNIINHIETLPSNPEIGRLVPEFQMPHIRELIHSPFRVVYTLNDASIQIIRVWRSERLMKLPEHH